MLAPAAWAAFTAGEGDGYGGPLSVLFDESPASAAKDVMRKVLLRLINVDSKLSVLPLKCSTCCCSPAVCCSCCTCDGAEIGACTINRQ
jgi:hypothetical protein